MDRDTERRSRQALEVVVDFLAAGESVSVDGVELRLFGGGSELWWRAAGLKAVTRFEHMAHPYWTVCLLSFNQATQLFERLDGARLAMMRSSVQLRRRQHGSES